MEIKDIGYSTSLQPRQMRLDSITKCNAKCLSCHRFKSERQGEMSSELLNEILDDVSKWQRPLTEIIPVNYGEFFLREDWYDNLVKINTKLPATQIVIPTNGTQFNDETIDKICRIPSVRIINFSVNAYFAETYKNFTGLPPENIDKIRRAVARLRILRPDITLWASMVFNPQYQTDLERDLFINYWAGWAVPQILPAASANRNGKLVHPVKLPCRSIFSDFVIGYDGKLSSCCFDSNFSIDLNYYSGDILKDWHNSELENLRKLHNTGRRTEVDLCEHCTFA